MKMRRFLAAVLALLLSLTALPAFAAEPAVNASEVTLYALDSWASDGYLTIPAAYPESFQIQVSNAQHVTYRRISGSSADVSADGVITPHCDTYYWVGNVGSTAMPADGVYDRVTVSYSYGTSLIRVTADGTAFDITVDVKNYADVYAEGVIDQYIAEHIRDSMTLYEKMDLMCQFVASYDYRADASGATSMIVKGGGDCWASTSALLWMCKKLGIEAVARNGNRDPGAGSGHRNVLVIAGDGEYYELEAGYAESAPRYYSITRRTSLFCYSATAGGIIVYQYDGVKNDLTRLEIPQTIDGKTVLGIADSFLTLNNTIEEIVLPDTLQTIGKSAFNSCTALKKLHLPAGVREVGDFAFTACKNLTELTCAEGNPYFTARDGALYSKDMTELIAAPACAQLELPQTLERIRQYAFYHNDRLKEITLPASVQTLEEGAFGDCSALEKITLQDGLETIGAYAFCNCAALRSVNLPDSVKTIGDKALGYTRWNTVYSDFVLAGSAGSAAQAYAQEHEILFVDRNVPTWLTTEKGTSYYENGAALTGWQRIDGICYYFSDLGYREDISSEELRNYKPATCLEEGYSGDAYCICCGELLHTGEVLPLAEHAYHAQTTAPTCKTQGYTTYTCTVCGDSYVGDYTPTRCPGACFTDLPGKENWAHEGIDFAIERGLVNGTTPTTFSPKKTMTRAMLVTLLWRYEGEPEAENGKTFTDVSPKQYYAKAVAWASGEGIVNGMTETTFQPNGEITREQMAVLFYRYAEWKGVDMTPRADISGFPDYSRVSGYAREAFRWANATNLIGGSKQNGVNYLLPKGSATREQVATLLMRFIRNIIEE